MRGHRRGVWCVVFSPVDQCVATSSADCTIKLWAVEDCSCVKVGGPVSTLLLPWSCIARYSIIHLLYFSLSYPPTSKSLPSFLRPPLFLPLTSSLTSQTFEGHETSVLKVTFATRGMQLVSSGNDGLVKVWTIRTNECATTLDGHSDKVRRVPSGREGRKGERERVPGRGGAGEGRRGLGSTLL